MAARARPESESVSVRVPGLECDQAHAPEAATGHAARDYTRAAVVHRILLPMAQRPGLIDRSACVPAVLPSPPAASGNPQEFDAARCGGRSVQ